MSRKRTTYSPAFKTKLVLELLKNEQTLSQISSTYNVTPQNLKNWKKVFLDNAEIAMEPSLKRLKKPKKSKRPSLRKYTVHANSEQNDARERTT